MSNVNMLDPVAYMEIMKSGTGHKTGLYLDTVRGFPVGDYELYTEDQMEAYANARVKEALEKAASIADQQHFGGDNDDDLSWTSCAANIAADIRILIPKEQK